MKYFREHNGKRATFGILMFALAAYGYIANLNGQVTIWLFGFAATLLFSTAPIFDGRPKI